MSGLGPRRGKPLEAGPVGLVVLGSLFSALTRGYAGRRSSVWSPLRGKSRQESEFCWDSPLQYFQHRHDSTHPEHGNIHCYIFMADGPNPQLLSNVGSRRGIASTHLTRRRRAPRVRGCQGVTTDSANCSLLQVNVAQLQLLDACVQQWNVRR